MTGLDQLRHDAQPDPPGRQRRQARQRVRWQRARRYRCECASAARTSLNSLVKTRLRVRDGRRAQRLATQERAAEPVGHQVSGSAYRPSPVRKWPLSSALHTSLGARIWLVGFPGGDQSVDAGGVGGPSHDGSECRRPWSVPAGATVDGACAAGPAASCRPSSDDDAGPRELRPRSPRTSDWEPAAAGASTPPSPPALGAGTGRSICTRSSGRCRTSRPAPSLRAHRAGDRRELRALVHR